MNEPAYPFRISDNALDYQFESVSKQRTIVKAVQFTPFADNALLYNLALADVSADGAPDDSTVTSNRDTNRVMATVFSTLMVFFEHFPSKLVYFQGSDKTGIRTRLHRVLIARELDEVAKLFSIYGRCADDSIEEFTPNHEYTGFIFQRRPS